MCVKHENDSCQFGTFQIQIKNTDDPKIINNYDFENYTMKAHIETPKSPSYVPESMTKKILFNIERSIIN